jgi:hypothetical protein
LDWFARTFLKPGVMTRVGTRGHGIISTRWYEEIGSAIDRLRSGERLTHADSLWLRGVEPDISSWGEIVHPLPLERLAP